MQNQEIRNRKLNASIANNLLENYTGLKLVVDSSRARVSFYRT